MCDQTKSSLNTSTYLIAELRQSSSLGRDISFHHGYAWPQKTRRDYIGPKTPGNLLRASEKTRASSLHLKVTIGKTPDGDAAARKRSGLLAQVGSRERGKCAVKVSPTI